MVGPPAEQLARAAIAAQLLNRTHLIRARVPPGARDGRRRWRACRAGRRGTGRSARRRPERLVPQGDDHALIARERISPQRSEADRPSRQRSQITGSARLKSTAAANLRRRGPRAPPPRARARRPRTARLSACSSNGRPSRSASSFGLAPKRVPAPAASTRPAFVKSGGSARARIRLPCRRPPPASTTDVRGSRRRSRDNRARELACVERRGLGLGGPGEDRRRRRRRTISAGA